MDIENASTRTGRFVLAPKAAYHTFEPKPLPFKIKYDDELAKLLSEANLGIGKLSVIGKRLSNPDLIVWPYLQIEAVLSSRIEGTMTSLSEAFRDKEPNNPDRVGDWAEVMNYRKVLYRYLQEMENKNFSEETIKDIHLNLMKRVRGESKNPGKYKTQPNWIGDTLNPLEARFVPAHPSSVPDLMRNLIDYMNSNSSEPELLKIALIHYQFESIHPFEDGNGRMGRLLLVLYLCKKKVLPKPYLYLSAYFEKNKQEYKNKLFEANSKGKLEDWLKFFLKAVKTQSEDVLSRTNGLEEYYQQCSDLLKKVTKSNRVLSVLDMLIENPYIRIPKIVDRLKCEWPTAKNCVEILLKHGILQELKDGPKREFVAPKIRQIFSRDYKPKNQ